MLTSEKNEKNEEVEVHPTTKGTKCIYCNSVFSKVNRPLVLKCSHNICQTCHSLNKYRVLCLICKVKYEGKEARRFPINFLLLEIVVHEKEEEKKDKKTLGVGVKQNKRKKSLTIKDEKIAIEPVEVFKCVQCELFFPNKFHWSIYSDHEMKEEFDHEGEAEKDSLMARSESLMLRYKAYNKNFEKCNEAFFDYLSHSFKLSVEMIKKELLFNTLDSLDIFMIFGLINKTDVERIKEFNEKYLINEKFVSIYNKSNSFEELITNLSSNKEIKIHHFLSTYFYYQEIIDKKINPVTIRNKIDSFIKDLNSDSIKNEENAMRQIFKLFVQDVQVEVYNSLNLEQDINKNIKLPFIVYGTSVIIFDPMTESIKTFDNIIPEEFSPLEKFSCCVTSDYKAFITGGTVSEHIVTNNCFSVNLTNREVKSYSKMQEPRYDHSSIIINNKLYVLSGKTRVSDDDNDDKDGHGDSESEPFISFERLNILDNTWQKLPTLYFHFKNKPTLLNFEDDYIYVFDDLSNFFYYAIKGDKWAVCKPAYRGAYHLELKNFTTIYFESNVLILGGVNSYPKADAKNEISKEEEEEEEEEKEVNNHIYFLKDIGSLVTHKGDFSISDTSSLIDQGFMIDNHYLIEYSQNKKAVSVFHSKELNSYKWTNILNIQIGDKK